MKNQHNERHNSYRVALLALLFFLVIRLLFAVLTSKYPAGGITLDSGDYIDLSESIRFDGNYFDSDGSTDFLRPPVYPLFLALFQSQADLNQLSVSLVQLGLGSLLSLLILYCFNRQEYSSTGLFAGWLIAVSPNLILWSLTVMSEMLFSFLLGLAFILLFLGINKHSGKMIFGSGLMIGLATLTRPIGLVIAVLWTLYIVIILAPKWTSLRLSQGLWFFVGSAIVIMPWMIRNNIIHNVFNVSDVGSHTLESFNFAIVISEAEGISRNDATYVLSEVGDTWNQFRWIVSNYPQQFIKSQLAGIGRALWGIEITRWATVSGHQGWNGFGVFRFLRELDWKSAFENIRGTFQALSTMSLLVIYIISILHSLLLILLSIGSFLKIASYRVQERKIVLLSIITALTLIFITGAAGQARFRVPAEPFLAITAGFGWWRFIVNRQERIG